MNNQRKHRCPFCLEEYDSFEDLKAHMSKCNVYLKLYKSKSHFHQTPYEASAPT